MERSLKKNLYSARSELAAEHCPGKKLLSSQSAGWRSIFLQTYEQQGRVEQYDNKPSDDHLFLMAMGGEYDIESWTSRDWRQAVYRPGYSAWMAPHIENRFRWKVASSGGAQLMKLYIPQHFFAEAQEEYRRAGIQSNIVLPDASVFADPVVFSIGKVLAAQVMEGMPDLCAEAGARSMATHLLAKANRWSETMLSRNPGFALPERQFSRVIEFMQHNFSKDVSLHTLAIEAGVSQFHFSRIFKRRFGVAPHGYLTRIRMEHATLLLIETDLSIGEVALACGYDHQGHFAAAFRRHYSIAPSGFRTSGILKTSLKHKTFSSIKPLA